MGILNDSPILLSWDSLLDSLSINYCNFSYRVSFILINPWFEACKLNIWIKLSQNCNLLSQILKKSLELEVLRQTINMNSWIIHPVQEHLSCKINATVYVGPTPRENSAFTDSWTTEFITRRYHFIQKLIN